jgi:NADPH:quinone reductase-like Zn-dependent oxidoreductase
MIAPFTPQLVMAESRRARAFWVEVPGRGALRGVSLPPRRADEVLVRACFSGISRGSESLVFSGHVPPSQYGIMRCPFQEGDFPTPVKYGYASVGIVEEGPPSLEGQRVFCLYPHQERYIVPADAVLPLPAALPDRRAVLAANMETALNGLWDAAPLLGDAIAVVGAGVVGGLVAALAARLPGAEIELVDIDPGRAALAAHLGCRFALPENAAGEADLVIHASGHPSGLETALRLAGFEAAVVEMSWYGDRPVAAPLGEAFHSRRLTLRSSQVGAVAPAQRARWSHRRRLALALDLLVDPVFDHLVGGESDFAALPETMSRLARHPQGELCHVVRYGEGAGER